MIYMNGEVTIVFSTDINYLNQTFVTMWSILKYRKNVDRKYRFYVLIPGAIEEEIKSHIIQMESAFDNFDVIPYTMDGRFDGLTSCSGRVPSTTFYRLLLPDILECPKCLYLDQDIAVLNDVADIFDAEIGENYVGAVKDHLIKFYDELSSEYKLDDDEYFNAGVLLLNLSALRKAQWNTATDELLKKKFIYGDQDILNIICKDKVHFFSKQMNCMCGESEPDNGTYIIHYVGYSKPWNHVGSPFMDYWWNECHGTPYFNTFFKNASEAFFEHYLEQPNRFELIVQKNKDKSILIYGAGNIAQRAIPIINRLGGKVCGVAVSEIANQPEYIDGIKVDTIDRFIPEKDNIEVWIAVRHSYEDIMRTMAELGFKNVRVIESYF